MVILVQLFIVMFGLDPNIQVKQRSLFLPWIPVSIPRLRLRSGTRMTADGSSPNMTLENFYPNKASTLLAELAASESALVASCWRVWSAK